MISEKNSIVTIKCDKCGKTQDATKENYNEVFWKNKWLLNNGRKYEHLCFNCLPKNKKKALSFLHTKLI